MLVIANFTNPCLHFAIVVQKSQNNQYLFIFVFVIMELPTLRKLSHVAEELTGKRLPLAAELASHYGVGNQLI